MQPIIDTHVHVWDLKRASYPWLQNDTSVLHRNYTLQELEPDRRQTAVTAGVLVQAAGNPEDTALLLETARNHAWIKGIVGWLPLTEPGSTRQLLEQQYLADPYFKGVRHQVHDEKDPRWLLQPAVIESLQVLAQYDLPYDMVGIQPVHIETAIEAARQVPGLRMVFDHLNQPPIAAKERFGQWGQWMKAAAQHPNVYAKISGLGTAAGNAGSGLAADLAPYIEFVLEHFGTDRCFCGGDWPVSLLAASYQHTWQAYESVLSSLLNEKDLQKILYTNAAVFYDLTV